MEKSEKVKRSDGDAINMETMWLHDIDNGQVLRSEKSVHIYGFIRDIFEALASHVPHISSVCAVPNPTQHLALARHEAVLHISV